MNNIVMGDTEGIYSLENISYFRQVALDNINKNEFISKDLEQKNILISEELLTLGEVNKLLIKLKNSKMFEKKDFILNTINTALNDVFIDQNVKIDLVASNSNQEASKLNIKYDIVLYQNGVALSKNDKMVEQNGGGVISFISILFKILVGFIYSRNRFYIFDESLSEVSEVYLPRIGQFLQKFCKVHKFTIILITHAKSISEYADITYYLDGEFENGVSTLKIDKIEGEYPQENYIYSKIENFQSIKKLEFRYKGFTTIIGKNNIGKSASFRAINSILFNNFDIKLHPRFESAEKPDKLLNTKVEFGFFSTKNDPENEIKKISFYKKGQGIIWSFNDMEFVGKNLAFEKVKEKIESIGFKYLKLKEQYKNFKGNLKDQTERLAITTQQDGYYLIAGKTSDTSKVFDFLFDSREVTLALIKLNEDIKSLESDLNKNTQDIGLLTFQTSKLRIELRKWDLQYKIAIISLFQRQVELNLHIAHSLEDYLQESNKINNILNLADIIWRIDNIQTHNNEKNQRIKFLEYSIALITKSIDLITKKHLLENLIYENSKLLKLGMYKNLKEIERKMLFINELLYVNNYTQQLKTRFNFLRSNIIFLEKLITNTTHRNLISNIVTTVDNYEIGKRYFERLKIKFNLLDKILGNLKNRISLINLLEQLNSGNLYLQKIQNSIVYNSKCLDYYNKGIKLNQAISLRDSIQKEIKANILKSTQIDSLRKTLDNLPSTFGLSPCRSCNTFGFTCEEHQ